MADNNRESLGRKIFFLHPSAVILNQIISELAQEEYEVYYAKNEMRLLQGLKKFPDSIVFANINEGMKEGAWDDWIQRVQRNPENAGISIGIISSTDNENLRNKYLNQLKVACGFTAIKSDLSIAIRQIINALEGVNAKGRRKYIRAVTENETNITVNLPLNGTFINGTIKDISTVGFSCSFTDDPGLAKNSLITDIQIRLASQLIKAEGIVFGSRLDGDKKTYVILFSQRTSPDVRVKIRKFISFFLQTKMDADIK